VTVENKEKNVESNASAKEIGLSIQEETKKIDKQQLSKFAASQVGLEWNQSLIDSFPKKGGYKQVEGKKSSSFNQDGSYLMFVDPPFWKEGDSYIVFIIAKRTPPPISLPSSKFYIQSFYIE
jgi:hypothetical protein